VGKNGRTKYSKKGEDLRRSKIKKVRSKKINPKTMALQTREKLHR
jgi:hypothetical protein